MKREDFEAAIKEFFGMYCEEYTREHSWKMVEDEELRAEISVELFDGEKYEVPLCVNETFDEVGIDIGDCGCLPLEPASYYAYLWLETADRVRKLRDNIVDLHTERALLYERITKAGAKP